MIAHVVLFRPRPNLSADQRRELAAAFEAALRDIPSVRRARVGTRVVLGRPYEALMRADYPYIAILEFDNQAGLSAYLDHPSHADLAAQFFSAFEEALLYDFELGDATVTSSES